MNIVPYNPDASKYDLLNEVEVQEYIDEVKKII